MESYKPQPPTTRDVEKIFSKLEDEKVLEKINELYFKAFLDSSKNILEGLTDNNDDLALDPRVKGFHENALTLFKNKFTLASHVMIETMFNYVLSKKTPRLETRKSLGGDRSSINRSDLDLIESQRDKEDEVSRENISRDQIEPSKVKTLTKSQKALKVTVSPAKKWKKKETSPSAKAVKELTYVLRANRGTPQKKIDTTTIPNSHRTSNTASKPKSPLSQALSSRSPSRMQSFLSTACTIKNNSALHDKSITTPLGSQSPSQTFLNQTALNQTMPLSPRTSIRTHQNPNNHSVSFVQSEFNYIRGPATFGHSPRSSWVDAAARTDSPGPGKYDPKLRNNSPSPSIGRAPRVSWVDTIARTDSPGPGAYNILNNTNSSPRLSIGKAPKVSWIDAISRTESPGPGAYETPNTNTSPRLSIGRAPRVSWVDVIARTESPGPGRYEINNSTNNSPRISIGKAPKIPWIDVIARSDSPGPGAYNPKVRSGSPSPSIGKAVKKCWVDEVARNESPGPASYYPAMHFVSK